MDWIKVVCNILDHRKIKMIRKAPEGNTLVLLWLLILAEAGKCNRGGYLMVSDTLPYSAETLSMVTDIPLPTVQLGLEIFTSLSMIDQQDDAIYIKNWVRYQSEEKLEARREKDRERKQLQRRKEREKILALEGSKMSRDSHCGLSRDVTPENRGDEREEKTTEQVRLLLSETPLSFVTDEELLGLVTRYGIGKLLLVADVGAETWRQSRGEVRNPGGYLQTLCKSLVVPDWYVPIEERTAKVQALEKRKVEEAAEKAKLKAREEAQANSRNNLWDSLPEERREEYLTEVRNGLNSDLVLPVAVIAMAKMQAWNEAGQPWNDAGTH